MGYFLKKFLFNNDKKNEVSKDLTQPKEVNYDVSSDDNIVEERLDENKKLTVQKIYKEYKKEQFVVDNTQPIENNVKKVELYKVNNQRNPLRNFKAVDVPVNKEVPKNNDPIEYEFNLNDLSQDFLDYSGFDKNFTGYLNDKSIYLKVYEIVKDIESETKIPKIVHLCYGFSKNCDFEFFNYLCILTIVNRIKPDKIILYHHHKITGKWWDRAKIYLTTVQTGLVTNVFGRDVKHFAHMSDVVRLEMLRFAGGIYMDIDTFVNKSFDDLLDNEFVMGIQNSGGKQEREYYGLCNAIMLSEKDSVFSNKWLLEYKTFNEQQWDYHSVVKPYYLAKEYPDNITILEEKMFFPFLWGETFDYLFTYNEEYANILKNCYSMHLWETITKKDLLRLNYQMVLDERINLSVIFKDILYNNIDKTVSLVFLTHNRPEKTIDYLNTYLDALNRYDVLELLIYDNDSTNNELLSYLRKIEKENPKVRIIYGLENIGVAGGRNVLFKEAKGDIIFSLDSDSKLLNNGFINEAKEILNDPGIWICGTVGAYFKSWKFKSHEDLNDDNFYEGDVDMISGCCQIFRRDLLEKVSIDLAFQPFWYEDTDFSFQSLYLGGINYRFHCKNNFLHKWGGSGSKIFGNALFGEKHKIFEAKWTNKIENKLKYNRITEL
jgi:GT2 family glycosyltransferase